MAGRSKKVVRGGRAGGDAGALLATYARWLKRQPLAPRSRDAYLAQVRGFVTWLAGSEHGRDALSDPQARDRAVRDYKRHAKKVKRWAPATVNQALAGIDTFYRSLAAGRPAVNREHLAQVAPRSLEEADQRSFLRAVEASPSPRDRAMGTVFFYAGLRLSELAALDVADVGDVGQPRPRQGPLRQGRCLSGGPEQCIAEGSRRLASGQGRTADCTRAGWR